MLMCHKQVVSLNLPCVPFQASGQSPKSKSKTPNRAAPASGGKKTAEAAKKSKKQAETGEEEATSSTNSTPKKATAASCQNKKNSASTPNQMAPKPDSPACVKRAKTARDNNRDLGLCR